MALLLWFTRINRQNFCDFLSDLSQAELDKGVFQRYCSSCPPSSRPLGSQAASLWQHQAGNVGNVAVEMFDVQQQTGDFRAESSQLKQILSFLEKHF